METTLKVRAPSTLLSISLILASPDLENKYKRNHDWKVQSQSPDTDTNIHCICTDNWSKREAHTQNTKITATVTRVSWEQWLKTCIDLGAVNWETQCTISPANTRLGKWKQQAHQRPCTQAASLQRELEHQPSHSITPLARGKLARTQANSTSIDRH